MKKENKQLELRATRHDTSTANDGSEDNLILEFPPALYTRFLPLLMKLQQEGYSTRISAYASVVISSASYLEGDISE